MEEKRLYDLYIIDKDIEYLENWLSKKNVEQEKVTIEDIKFDSALENLIEKYKDLEIRNKELEIINKMQEYRISVIDERELIPKSKVKEKIEEFKNKTNDDNYWKLTNTQCIQYYFGIDVLQELLEEDK